MDTYPNVTLGWSCLFYPYFIGRLRSRIEGIDTEFEVVAVTPQTFKCHHNRGAACPTLLWRHHRRDGVSNHQPHGCLFNRLFKVNPRIKGQRRGKCFLLMTSSCPNWDSAQTKLQHIGNTWSTEAVISLGWTCLLTSTWNSERSSFSLTIHYDWWTLLTFLHREPQFGLKKVSA